MFSNMDLWLIVGMVALVVFVVSWTHLGLGRWFSLRLSDSDYHRIDQQQFEDFIERSQDHLTERTTHLDLKDPLIVEYVDCLGTPVALMVRWPKGYFYMVKSNWFDAYGD